MFRYNETVQAFKNHFDNICFLDKNILSKIRSSQQGNVKER